ncbi:MAG: coproporphyrinogen III oxidase [Actinobacteria bacterium]|nr:MAG: coproporphyrinogen III oxidase [Actinomycetota bacterium]
MCGVAQVAPGAFGVYVHVPYCASRCGYCDFNTYTAAELGPGLSRATYADDVIREIDLAAAVLDGRREIATVFFGGGTPTLLPAADLVRVLDHLRGVFGLAEGAEVTTEANPETVDPQYLEQLRAGGFTRVSLGMQSASEPVLAILQRRHTAGRAVAAAREAAAAGFDRVSLDLIYGTPGEDPDQWRASLDAALAAGVGHVSAYALTVEPGTAMGAAVARGSMPAPDPDVAASAYEVCDDVLGTAGLEWYEISNWARPGHECRHNLGYWSPDGQWWGFGPGAHSLIDGARFHNVKHPRGYAQLLRRGELPRAAVEQLSAEDRRLEAVMLGLRLRAGLPAEGLPESEVAALVADGLLQRRDERVVLTRTGRLLADRVTLSLLG